ncbi:MAG: P-II family nitrogen regulator [Dehalococcoidia bacterium]|nr:P-II family nitrogen regulator [Dehalococcoidia bacterium]
MKKIEAIVREESFDAIKRALEEKGYFGMTVSHVEGRGRQKGLKLQQRSGEFEVDLIPKVKVEVVVLDEDAMTVLRALAASARTGDIGDGKIFVIPVEDALRIRTGESGMDAV